MVQKEVIPFPLLLVLHYEPFMNKLIIILFKTLIPIFFFKLIPLFSKSFNVLITPKEL